MPRHHPAHLLLALAAASALLWPKPSGGRRAATSLESQRRRAADRLDNAATSLETFKPSEVFQGGFHDNDKAVRRARRRAQDRVAVAYHAAKREGLAPTFDSEDANLDDVEDFERRTGFELSAFDVLTGESGDDRRVAAHEAGHLLASYALGVPAVDCTLTPFDALWQNKVGGLDRAAPASAFCDGALQDALSSGKDSELVDRYAVVIAAGAAAEALEYGRARLHAHDERILVSLFREDYRRKRRAALARAVEIVGARRAALQRLTAHLLQFRGRSIGATMLVIDDESYQPSDLLTATRRQVSSLFAPLLAFAAAPPAYASDWPEFDAIREELKGAGTGGLAFMQQKIAAKDYGELREFTKQWDLDFRKAVLGKARKAMPKGPDRDRAVLVANAVTFDLIGINKAIRNIGNEDDAEARRWFDTLVDDIRDYLTLEPKGPRPPPEG